MAVPQRFRLPNDAINPTLFVGSMKTLCQRSEEGGWSRIDRFYKLLYDFDVTTPLICAATKGRLTCPGVTEDFLPDAAVGGKNASQGGAF